VLATAAVVVEAELQEGVVAGQPPTAPAPNGQEVTVTVPEGMVPGQQLLVEWGGRQPAVAAGGAAASPPAVTEESGREGGDSEGEGGEREGAEREGAESEGGLARRRRRAEPQSGSQSGSQSGPLPLTAAAKG